MPIEINYYYTSFGDVYAGIEFDEHLMKDYIVIIQLNKIIEYNKLPVSERIPEKIAEFGWTVPKHTFIGKITSNELAKPAIKDVSTGFDGRYDRKNLFIFGAGASANCIHSSKSSNFVKDPLRPPLGNELFADRFKPIYKNYEGVRQSLFDLQSKGINVEEYLEIEWKEVQGNGNKSIISRHINIQFYLQEILKQISELLLNEYFEANLFAKFASKLQILNSRNPNKHFAFISFNQDTILENFITKYFKKPLKTMDDYIEVNDRPFCIFKPHGSWNWGWSFRSKQENWANYLFENDSTFFDLYYKFLGDHINMVDWNSFGIEATLHPYNIGKLTIDKSQIQIIDAQNISNYFPALLLPYRDKDEFTMPPKHYHCLSGYLMSVENLFIIGWKGNEAAFNKLLFNQAKNLKKIIIVDPNPSIVEENLKQILDKDGLMKVYYKDFEDFVSNGTEKELA